MINKTLATKSLIRKENCMFQSLEAKHPKFYQVFRFFVVIAASIFYAWNLRCFAKTAGLFPGGFSGLSLLLQEIGLAFFGISIPYTLLNVLLNHMLQSFEELQSFCPIRGFRLHPVLRQSPPYCRSYHKLRSLFS